MSVTRRRLLQALPVLGAGGSAAAQPAGLLTRPLRAGSEPLARVGLGSWITFNVGSDRALRDSCAAVVRAFFAGGGRLIDSSPMYGSAQAVIGDALQRLGGASGGVPVFSADKVWTSGRAQGESQIEASRRLWGVPRFDLLQVHNLLDWQAQLPLLLAMKAAGRVRLVGISTSEGRRHREVEEIMRTQPIDTVQLSYNLLDREAEQRLLPLAAERGIGVIVNRPFREGALLRDLQRHPLPPFAAELGCDGWAQLALKFILSHPAVSIAIPATSRVDHVQQNLGAARGPLPDAALRARLAAHVAAL